MNVQVKRVYEPFDEADGTRVLIDRLWPRGVSKANAHLDLWLKDIAPSAELRKTWHADPQGHEQSHFEAFIASYLAELSHSPAKEALDKLVQLARTSDVLTLLYSSHDTLMNHAHALRDEVLTRLQG